MKTRTTQRDLDSLVRQHTGFAGLADLQASVAGGYVPTILKPRKGGEQRLVRMLEARGVRVYTGAR